MLWIYTIILLTLFSLLYTLVDIYIYLCKQKEKRLAAKQTRELTQVAEEICTSNIQVVPTATPVTMWFTLVVNAGSGDLLATFRAHTAKEACSANGIEELLITPRRGVSHQGSRLTKYPGIEFYEAEVVTTEGSSGIYPVSEMQHHTITSPTVAWIFDHAVAIMPLVSETEVPCNVWNDLSMDDLVYGITTETEQTLTIRCFSPGYHRQLPLVVQYDASAYRYRITPEGIKPDERQPEPDCDILINERSSERYVRGWFTDQRNTPGSTSELRRFRQDLMGNHLLISFELDDVEATTESIINIDRCPIEIIRPLLEPIFMGYYAAGSQIHGILVVRLVECTATDADKAYGPEDLEHPRFARPRPDYSVETEIL